MLKSMAAMTLCTVLMACGPGAKIDGKQGAAEALFAASQPTKANMDTTSSPIDLTGGITWNCPEGGSAKISGAAISFGTSGGSTGVTISYTNCGLAKSSAGIALYNGELTVSQEVGVTSTTASVSQRFKGKVLVQGAYDDFIDADVSQEVNVGDLGTTGKSVSMRLRGDIATSEGSFSFDQAVEVTSGTISVKASANK